jgi:threonyl-tRNA synthetase
MVKDAIGRKWQLGTIQVDYNLPERFDLTYIGEDNAKHRPVMIHRAPFGSMERFVAVLIEHCAGKFPLWLAPTQAVILPISDKFLEYAEEVRMRMRKADIRVELDERNEKIGKKIREAEMNKIPYMFVVGEKEVQERKVAVRKQSKGDIGIKTLSEAEDLLKEEIDSRQAFE